jgi:CRISPR-associated protein Cas2
MTFSVLVTRNVEPRVRGFLGSCMLEIASGVYTCPKMSAAVRDRVWAVLEKWQVGEHQDSAVLTWADATAPGGQLIRSLGEPVIELCETPGLVLARRNLSEAELRSLTIQLSDPPPF